MEHLGKAISQIRNRVWLVSFCLQLSVGLACLWLVSENIINVTVGSGMFLVISLGTSALVGWLAGSAAKIPLQALGNAVLHVSPSDDAVAPQTEDLKVGREYVTRIVYQLYEIASLQNNKDMAEHKREATQASNILTRLPLPLFVFNNEQVVTFASDSAISYTGQESAQLFGKPIFETMDLEFPSDFTLESWIDDCAKNKATDTAYWRRVRLRLKDDAGTMRQCDLAGYYNRDNPKGIEFIVTLFDRTAEYSQDDSSISFIALAVHELRTPLTLMRGLIEVFEDELTGKMDAELATFMKRLKGSAHQLASFVNNILNVAKIEENQLSVKLAEEKWPEIVKHAAEDMNVKAQGMGIELNFSVAAELPTVGADRLMAYEVLCNLLDNALKYSGTSKLIDINIGLNQDGLVETSIVDHGVGIPSNVLPQLFEKFHRNHRNRSQIAGTGLGLFLSKAIINAHGGDIWVRSKEGEGTTVGFTLKPYAKLADELKTGNNKDDMVRTAHGWIKNHSLYRR